MTQLTLEEFRASRKLVQDVSYLSEDDEPIPGYVYGGDACYIYCDEDGSNPHLVIFNQEYHGKPLAELERLLYEEFYVPEIGEWP